MSDTSAIDEKKNEETSANSSKTYTSKVVGFLISIIITILIVLIYFSSGGLILYLCKLAQSNILPTESNCYPYTDSKPNIQAIKTNIFTTNTDPELSVKLEFPYDDKNAKNKLIEMFKEYKNKPSSNFLANYFISINESLLQFNYSAINNIMNFLNGLPEGLIIGLGPIITAFLFGINLIINQFYFIYLWFSNMSWFFKENTNNSGQGKPKWEDTTFTSPLNYGLSIGLVILFIILFFIGFPLLTFIPFIIVMYCCVSIMLYKGTINNKSVSSFTIIKEVLKHYKISFVTTISIFIILLSFSKLGAIPGVFSIITVGLIYWGFISIDIFKPIPESNLSPVVSYEQAKKTCVNKDMFKEKHGFLYNLLLGQKGGNITNELKKIGKTLSTN